MKRSYARRSAEQKRRDRAATRKLRDLRRSQGLCLYCGDLLEVEREERAACRECARIAAIKARCPLC